MSIRLAIAARTAGALEFDRLGIGLTGFIREFPKRGSLWVTFGSPHVPLNETSGESEFRKSGPLNSVA